MGISLQEGCGFSTTLGCILGFGKVESPHLREVHPNLRAIVVTIILILAK